MNQHLTSDRLIAYHRSQQNYQPNNQNTLQLAYSNHRYVRITSELLNQSDILKKKILLQLIEDFSLYNYLQNHRCDNINLCLISSDILSVLFQHIENLQSQIRKLSTKVIQKICYSNLGREIIINRKIIQKFQHLIDDHIDQIRSITYDGLIDFTNHVDGINCLLNSPVILPHLVDKLVEEKNNNILNKLIILLCQLMQGQLGTPKVLKTQIVSRLMNLISHSYDEIVANVCNTLANISFNYEGKENIIINGHLRNILKYLKHDNAKVRQKCCLLLCSLAQLNQGKIQILNQGQFEIIIELLNNPPYTALNTIQLIASLAQNPLGKKLAKQNIQKIQNVQNVDKKYVQATLEVINWEP